MAELRKSTPVGAASAPIPWTRAGALEEYEALCRARLDHVVPVSEPLVLVSQAKRSGGTLLSQLFDGHPECHAHAHELKIGYPRKENWPEVDLARPDTWFPMLHEARPAKDLARGYRKSPRPGDADVFPFLFSPRLQEALFAQCVAARSVERVRDVLDSYMTSYFNAWLDNHNLYTGPKKVVTAFTPQLVIEPESVDRFFTDYPEGTLISIVREPHSWFYSLREHDSTQKRRENTDVETALSLWRRSTEAILETRTRHPDRTLVITYEQLVGESESTMSAIARRIGIEMLPVLTSPTFNGRPIRANSSERVERHGILRERVDAYREHLDPGLIERIGHLAADLYETARRAALR